MASTLALLGPQLLIADLPVHCLQQQIFGSWTFHLGAPQSTPQLCGHHTPGEVRDVVTSSAPNISEPARRIDLRLGTPDLAELASEEDAYEHAEVGWWTMIYDQGFEVRLAGRVFFAFSSVVPSASSSGYASRCSTTAIGWYHELGNETHSDVWGCYHGVQTRRSSGSSSLPHSARAANDSRAGSASSWPPAHYAASQHAHASGWLDWLHASGGARVRAAADERPDALKYAGLPSAWDWRDVDGVNYVPPVRTQGSCGACYVIAAVAMLESRLAIASGGRERPTLSVQEMLSCSPYSQGCLGGFPYLVGKYLTDIGVSSDACFPTDTGEMEAANYTPPSCMQRCASPSRRWHASDYRYVGGRYGGCAEAAMMHEIYKHGPIVAGFQAGANLYSHRGDVIYASPPAPPHGATSASSAAAATAATADGPSRTTTPASAAPALVVTAASASAADAASSDGGATAACSSSLHVCVGQ